MPKYRAVFYTSPEEEELEAADMEEAQNIAWDLASRSLFVSVEEIDEEENA